MPRKPTKGAADTAAPALNPGQQILRARQAKGLTQAGLAKLLGVTSRTRVSDIENWIEGKRPSIQWFLEHGEVWAKLGLGPELIASLYAEAEVCPCCKRPF